MNWEEHDSFDREMEATEEKAAEQKTAVSAMREKKDLFSRRGKRERKRKTRRDFQKVRRESTSEGEGRTNWRHMLSGHVE